MASAMRCFCIKEYNKAEATVGSLTVASDLLFNMGVIIDVVFTITVVTVTTGAVAELQFRMGGIRTSAYCAPMGIGRRLGRTGRVTVSGTVKENGISLRLRLRLSLKETGNRKLPRVGDDPQDIFSEKEKVIGKGNQRE